MAKKKEVKPSNEAMVLPIDGTPFTMVKKADEDIKFGMGRILLGEGFKTEKEVIEYIDNNMWKVVNSLCVGIYLLMQEKK